MKRLLSVLLAVFLVLALAGCGGKDSGSPGTSSGGSDNIGSGNGDVYAEDGWAEGRLGDTMHAYWFNYTVNSAYTCSEFAGRKAAEGCKMLVVDITVKNTVTTSVEMYDTDFQAQWGGSGDEDYRLPITTDPETYEELDPISDDQLPGTYALGVNEERTGLLVYEVPADSKDFSISYLEAFEEGDEGDTFFVYFTPEEK
ncbi:DUF4352 domain-containing protein [uncultured Oscillibacter sp.]|uniref:DUF4352 domain-containing protein n=1 Tax=uncultured Oscillibacter sp. TaxID=876091 RepID=UPI0025F9DC5D|nr:DUF4352 domain-containing protein [uncultured Oscillibacter sp.]